MIPPRALAGPEEGSVLEPIQKRFLGVIDERLAGFVDQRSNGCVTVDGYDFLLLMTPTIVERGERIDFVVPAEVIDAPCVNERGLVDSRDGFVRYIDENGSEFRDSVARLQVLLVVQLRLELFFWRRLNEGNGVLLFWLPLNAENLRAVA